MNQTRPAHAPTAADLADARLRYQREAKFSTITTPRYRMATSDWGQSSTTPILFVHGLADQRMSFVMVMKDLVDAGQRCLCYELADGLHDGANLSRYTHDHFVDDLIFMLDEKKCDRIHIIGCSFGSTVTIKALTRHPDRFAQVILQGGFPYRPFNIAVTALAAVARFLPGTIGDLPRRRDIMEKLDKPQLPDCPPEVFEFLMECGGTTPCRTASHRAMILRTLDLRPKLPSIKHAVRLIGGDRDTVVPRASEAMLEAGLPNVHRVEIAPGGHYPQYAAPSTFATAVQQHVIG